jgi:hypothetical protein
VIEMKRWTFAVFLAGDNNLEVYVPQDLKEMSNVKDTRRINVVAQVDTSDFNPKRYRIEPGKVVEVQTLPETNTGDPGVYKDFIKWVNDEYPAKNYAIVLWNHGSGWRDKYIKSFIKTLKTKSADIDAAIIKGIKAASKRKRRLLFASPMIYRGFGSDDTSNDFINMLELKSIVKYGNDIFGKKIDVLGFDACLMSMIEVAYQLRDNVEYMVASENVESGEGWPYDIILSRFSKKPYMDPKRLTSFIPAAYMSVTSGRSLTMSGTEIKRSEKLAGLIDELSKAFLKNLASEKHNILTANEKTWKTREINYMDLRGFADYLRHHSRNQTIKNIAERVYEETFHIQEIDLPDRDLRGIAGGLSIYFPERLGQPMDLYKELDFAMDTKWDEFLCRILE